MIKYFLVEAGDDKLLIPQTSELKDVKWFSQSETLDKLGYDNAKEIFKNGLDKLGIK